MKTMLFRLVRGLLPGHYLMARHGAVARYGLGCLVSVATLMTTFEPVLARESWRSLTDDQFSTGFRRLSWYMRRSWLRINLSRDPIFVASQHLNRSELAAQARFLNRRASKTPQSDLLTERALLAACELALAFGRPEHVEVADRFDSDAAALLKDILTASQHQIPSRLIAADAPSRNEFDLKKAELALRETVAMLQMNGIHPFMLSGTFLGAVREGGILEHDYDIDLGVMTEDLNPARLQHVLDEAPGFRLITSEVQTYYLRDPTGRLKRHEFPVLHKLLHTSGVLIDIFLHHREEALIWHGSAQYRWENSAFSLRPWQIAGISLHGPADADRYLSENYGDWKTPKIDFHCAIDTNNQRLLPSPLSVILSLRQLWIATRSRPENFGPLLRQMQAAGYIRPDPEQPEGWSLIRGLFAP